MIVVFTGIDGCGKTLVSRLLALKLSKRGLSVRILWIKSLHTLAYIVYRLFTKLHGFEYIVNPKGMIAEHFCTSWMKRLGGLWGLIEFASILPWLAIVYVYKLLGYTIICDRFLVDFLATVSLRIGDPVWWARSFLGKFLLSLQRRTLIAHLKISLNTALNRRPDIEYELGELRELMAIYKLISENVGAHQFDGEKTSPVKTINIVEKIMLSRK